MSSLKDLASLIMVPSLYKDGELHTVKPLADEDVVVHPDATDNNDGFDGSTPSTSSNFTFSRGSNLAATRVDVNGLIEKGRENVLLQSNQFDTTWSASSTSITSGQSGYDGSNDAWLLQATASTSTARLQQAVSLSGVHTTSIYAKAGTTDWIAIQMWSNHFAYFDVANGVVGNSGSAIDTSIEAVGNGFYRCSITYNASSVGTLWVYVTDGNGSTSATSGKNVYLQSAQVERSLVATDYIETGTSAAQSGILEDMPRLDYSGSCPALLLEPQRQNIYTQSEYNPASSGASRLSWNGNKYNFCDSFSTPIPAFKAAGTGAGYLFNMVGLAATGEHTFSAFVKLPTINQMTNVTGVEINTFNQFSNSSTYFNLVNGTLVSSTANAAHIVSFPNGWYRIDVTETAISTTSGFGFLMYITDSGNNRIDIQSSDIGKDAIVTAGWQLEQGSYPTSYIPTYGTSQTRSKEQCNVNSVSGEIGQTQGTFFLDADLYKKTNTEFYIAISDGTLSNSIYLHQSSQSLLVNKRIAGATEFLQITSANWSSGRNKCAITYTATEMKIFVNGVLKDTETINGLPSGLSKLTLGSRQDNLGELASDADYKQALLFPTALTDSECIALTTL